MKTYNNTEGIDFELEYRKAEDAYADLWKDFLIVTTWNTDFAERYNYLAEILPSAEDVDLLIKHHTTRLSGMKTLISAQAEDTAAYRADRKLCLERIDALYKLKVAVSLLQDNPVTTARMFVKARHAYDNTTEPRLSWWGRICSRKKNRE